MRFPLAGVLLLALAAPAWAQASDEDEPQVPAVPTALDAELFYQLLLGEITARGDEPAAGYSLILDAARKTSDPTLYQRAVDVAFQSRSG